MSEPYVVVEPELEKAIWVLFRDFFDRAEKKRRWNIREDIPWDQCNRHLNPAIADVVESFCAVELYLPDYSGKILPVVRPSRGRTWFYANWGYEESKHSLAMRDWLLISGHRTEEQMTDLESLVFSKEWNLPHDNHLGMLVYAMTQELATFINYRNLQAKVQAEGGDGALDVLLHHVAIDEKAHQQFFMQCLELFLKFDRGAALEQMRRVMNNFAMPAIKDLLPRGPERFAAVKNLGIFDEQMYFEEVYLPLLEKLGVERKEMRSRAVTAKSKVAKDATAPI